MWAQVPKWVMLNCKNFVVELADQVKKHRLLATVYHEVGIRQRSGMQPHKMPNKMYVTAQCNRRAVEEFFIRDDVSRSTAGKKETVTRNKIKKQKRFLLHPVSEVYKKFCALNPTVKVSRSTFVCLKPFWVLRPRVQDRDTCLCKLHENSRLIHDKLRQLKLIPPCTLEDVLKHVVCNRDVTNRMCMINECKWCKDRSLPFVSDSSTSNDEAITWCQWQAVSESVDNKTVQRTVKRQVAGTVQDLKREYKELVQKMKPHVYTILNQYAVLSAKKEKLQQHEVLIHIDFSENWTIKHLSAAQSAHFGASLQQVTLHTGVAYFQNNQTISFCSITDNSNHGPTAV